MQKKEKKRERERGALGRRQNPRAKILFKEGGGFLRIKNSMCSWGINLLEYLVGKFKKCKVRSNFFSL